MPYVLRFNPEAAIEPRISALAAYLGLEPASFDGFLDWIVALRRDLGIPAGLAALGVREDQIERLAAMAEADPSAGGNPCPSAPPKHAMHVLEAAMRREA